VGRSAALGITVTDTPSTSGTTGATISGVIQGSAAEDAGLQAGDIITAVDGKQVEGASELSELIRSHSIGDKVTLSITRGTKTMDVTVTLKESSFN
jgi:S1-C subfamily serine protease